MEHRSQPQQVNRDDVTVAMSANRPVKIPLQPLGEGWEPIRAQVTLELWDNGRQIWSGQPPVANAAINLKNREMALTATQQSDGVVVTLTAAGRRCRRCRWRCRSQRCRSRI